MRYLASVAIGLILLFGAWLLKDGSVFTTGYQPPPDAPATIGTWVNIGPAPLSYIDNPADPGNWNSGRVAAIAVDPHDPNHWLSGEGNGGVWESVDGGTSWLPITDSGPTLATGAIAFAPSNPQTSTVSELEWQVFLRDEVTKRFPNGLTVRDAQGQWRTSGGTIDQERTKVLLVVHADSGTARAAVLEVIAKYRQVFDQQSVLWESARVCVAS